MAAARDVAASTIITQILYELRDPNGNNYNKDEAYAELLGYINKCNEFVYEILIDEESELILTGSGTVTTVDGTQSYDLSSNSMGDLWFPDKVWITNYDPMTMCEKKDLDPAIQAEEYGDSSRSIPDQYCLIGDYIWFKDVPDDAYTVNVRYFPNFTPLSAVTSYMPYKNLFNNEIIEGVCLYAKRRNELGFQAEAALKSLFMNKALKLMRKRRFNRVGFKPVR
ncbi:hypothetical protein [Pseudoalteromonas sp.]|uniref:phage adaptor protein n=1 Tax=Pseudoalteromonas sp. TaxID=53249 RepID=UPI00262F8403|nr:hypothetical protein [Pseudoalteromonas sp.]MCP4585325.1 hypothetical protein [Pseudoalteromonas sp.]